MSEGPARPRRLTAVLREEERVTPLELFFDLVFVLAITQCTALMAAEPTWAGLLRSLAVLAVLWWCWGGYAWLTSVVDPEEGAVRLAMFGAMAGLLVAALCVPGAFDDSALLFACAYGVVRVAHIALFVLASRDDPGLRYSVSMLAASTTLAVGLLTAAAFADGWVQGALWVVAVLIDIGGPAILGVEGWKLVPGHFAERHGLIVIIAIGRIDRCDRDRRGRRDRRRRRRGRRGRHGRRGLPSGGSTSTWSRWSRSGDSPRRSPAASRTRWPATRTPTSTFRWSRASSWSPSG